MLDRARRLIPRLAERAPAAAAARQLPAETVAEYHAAGILRILQPKRFGGHQGRFSLFSRIVEELTYGCASAAWVYAVLAEHQWIIAQYPEAAQIDVWGDDPLAVASSSLAPRAAAKPVAGGWRLSGRYSFSSGCDYAQWAITGAFLGEKGDPRPPEGTGFELLVRGRVKLVVGRRRQRKSNGWTTPLSMRIDQLVPPHQGRRGKDIVVLDRWGEDRTEDADEAQWLTVVDKGADGRIGDGSRGWQPGSDLKDAVMRGRGGRS